MKVYICLESHHDHEIMAKGEREVSVIGAFASRALAESAIGDRLDGIADEITGTDENNCSAISEIQPWNGSEAAIESEWCDRWEWRIAEEEVVVD